MRVVWFSEIKWHYLRTRKQQLIGKRPSSIDLLYLEPYAKRMSNKLTLRTEEGVHMAMVPFLKSPPDAVWRSVLSAGFARSIVDAVAGKISAKRIKEAGFDSRESVFLISNIFAIRAALKLKRSILVYDCNDAHHCFPGMPRWAEDYFVLTCKEADAVVASSKMLLEEVRSIRGDDNCFFVGNGVDFDAFALPKESIIKRIKADRFTLGYVGAVAPWLDFDLIGRIAAAHPEWKVELVGPVLPGADGELRKILEQKNISYSGPVAYEEVPKVLENIKAGIIPFRYNDLTRGVNPNKLYEYLASGLPVVSTGFSSEVIGCDDVVFVAGSHEDFLSSCEHLALMMSDSAWVEAAALKAQGIAREKDWGLIADAFWRRIKNLVTGR